MEASVSSGSPSVALVAVVGVCASGKTTLVNALCAAGYRARQVAQEHSGVPTLWQRTARPDVLIYLDASLETIRRRLRDPEWPAWLRERQVERLRHARANCDLYINTDPLTPDEVANKALDFLRAREKG